MFFLCESTTCEMMKKNKVLFTGIKESVIRYLWIKVKNQKMRQAKTNYTANSHTSLGVKAPNQVA